MKIRNIIIVASTFLVLNLVSASGQSSKDYDDLLKEIAQDKNLKSPRVLPLAESVLASATNRDMKLTAKVFMAQILAVRGDNEMRTNDIARACQLWTEVCKEGVGTWQAILSRFNLVVEIGSQGNHDEQINMVKDAFAHLDFGVLEKSQDPALKALRHAYGDKPNVFREILKLVLTNTLCDQMKIAEAKEVYRTIQDPEFAKIMNKRIQLAEKEEREQLLLKEAKEKAVKGNAESNVVFSSFTNAVAN